MLEPAVTRTRSTSLASPCGAQADVVIDSILPGSVVAVSTRTELIDARLFPVEAACVARSVEKRRREFTTARGCAHEALSLIGVGERAVPAGERGEPLWPTGVVGSITHCDGYRACVLAHRCQIATIGIDAEPNVELPSRIAASDIAAGAELDQLDQLRRSPQNGTSVHWDRLLFSAKETVYKAWYPLTKRWLGFEDAFITIDPRRRTFTAHLLVAGPLVDGRELTRFEGRWLMRDDLLLTAIALPRRPVCSGWNDQGRNADCASRPVHLGAS
jgi:4'-phosphopantetheinyl transferase EntD